MYGKQVSTPTACTVGAFAGVNEKSGFKVIFFFETTDSMVVTAQAATQGNYLPARDLHTGS